MLLYRLQFHSNFSLPLILFSLKYLISGKYHSSHTLGVNSLLHWIFPGRYSLFVYRIYEGIQPHYFLISWDSLVRFLLRKHGLVTWCFSAKVSLIGGIWTEIYVNTLVIFFEGVYVVRVGNEFEKNTVPRKTLRVTINEMSFYFLPV